MQQSPFSYSETNGEITISKYIGYEEKVIIPSKIDGKPVTAIGDNSFYECTSVLEIFIPEGVKTIGVCAFYKCTALYNISIPKSVSIIGAYAFNETAWLINIEEDFVIINNILVKYKGYDNIITIPNGITEVCDYVFYQKSNITSIIFPSSLLIVGQASFYGCSITSIIIPNKVTTIKALAFANCRSLATISIPSSLKNIGIYAFVNTAWFNNHVDDFVTLNGILISYKGIDTNVIIPRNINIIGEGAFYLTKITSVIISNSVTRIEKSAFESCDCLSTIIIPEGVIYIGDEAFEACISIQSISIPNSVTYLGKWSFYNCRDLSSITLSKGLEIISKNAFQNCSALQFITIPANVKTIEERAFSFCQSLSSVTLTNGIKNIDKIAFEFCDNLVSVQIPESVEYIGSTAFSSTSLKEINVDLNNNHYSSVVGILFNKDKTSLIIYPQSKINAEYIIPESVIYIEEHAFDSSMLSSIYIPDTVKFIGDYAFNYCKNLKSVRLSENLTRISNSMFSRCYALTTISFPESITHIGSNAFFLCDKLTSINIPKSVIRIENRAFDDCANLTKVFIPPNVIYIGGNAFEDCNKNLIIFGKSGSYADFHARFYFLKFVDIGLTYEYAINLTCTNNSDKLDIALQIYNVYSKECDGKLSLALYDVDNNLLDMKIYSIKIGDVYNSIFTLPKIDNATKIVAYLWNDTCEKPISKSFSKNID